jgi:hypothetical protein
MRNLKRNAAITGAAAILTASASVAQSVGPCCHRKGPTSPPGHPGCHWSESHLHLEKTRTPS